MSKAKRSHICLRKSTVKDKGSYEKLLDGNYEDINLLVEKEIKEPYLIFVTVATDMSV